MTALYRMDDATFEHLTAWCERVTLTPEEADLLRERIIVHLQQLPAEDADYSVSHGWPHVRDLLEEPLPFAGPEGGGSHDHLLD